MKQESSRSQGKKKWVYWPQSWNSHPRWLAVNEKLGCGQCGQSKTTHGSNEREVTHFFLSVPSRYLIWFTGSFTLAMIKKPLPSFVHSPSHKLNKKQSSPLILRSSPTSKISLQSKSSWNLMHVRSHHKKMLSNFGNISWLPQEWRNCCTITNSLGKKLTLPQNCICIHNLHFYS